MCVSDSLTKYCVMSMCFDRSVDKEQKTINVIVGMETEGIFRRCASVNVLQSVQKSFNEGML